MSQLGSVYNYQMNYGVYPIFPTTQPNEYSLQKSININEDNYYCQDPNIYLHSQYTPQQITEYMANNMYESNGHTQ